MSELRLKVATVWRGEWSAEVAYNVLDEVSFSAEAEGVKRGNYRSLLAANREPLSNENAWVLVLDFERTQSATEEAEEMNEAFAEAESKRVEAENKRLSAETGRADAESKRVSAENDRIEAENKRVTAESGRADAETNRRTAETVRISNEQARVSAESGRIAAEANRRIAEETRISNEQTRVSAENSRIAAEADRATAFANAQNERAEAFNEAEAGRDALITEKVGDITRLQGEVVKKANIDGYYSSMAVGAAESLIGQNATTQQFTFQPSGNTLDVQDGLAIVKSIKGNTVVANQMIGFKGTIELGTADFSADKIRVESNHISCCLPINTIEFEMNHKYYFSISYYFHSPESNPSVRLYLFGTYASFGWSSVATNFVIPNTLVKTTAILTAKNDSTSPDITIGYNSRIGENSYFDLYNYEVIDLTQMFGAGNEPVTVEEFECLYSNLPTEYNEGSLLNLNADAIKSVGFNAYNGEYAKVLGGMQYYLGGNITSLTFKENLEDEGEVIEIPSNKVFTPATNGYLFALGRNICINLSHSGYRNGEYEPYKESIVNLPIQAYFPDGMKSAGEVRDEIIWDEGLKKYKAIQRVGSVDLGTLSWREYAPFESFTSDSLKSIIPHRHVNLVTPKYKSTTDSQFQNRPFVDKLIATNEGGTILIRDYSSTTLEEFTTSIQGQILYYELEIPIETIIDDYDGINYDVSDFGTEEIIADEPTTPIVAEVVYGVNAVDTLRRLPQTYTSAESMRDFLAQLGSAMGGNWTMVFDDVNNKWVFAFEANTVVANEE